MICFEEFLTKIKGYGRIAPVLCTVVPVLCAVQYASLFDPGLGCYRERTDLISNFYGK